MSESRVLDGVPRCDSEGPRCLRDGAPGIWTTPIATPATPGPASARSKAGAELAQAAHAHVRSHRTPRLYTYLTACDRFFTRSFRKMLAT